MSQVYGDAVEHDPEPTWLDSIWFISRVAAFFKGLIAIAGLLFAVAVMPAIMADDYRPAQKRKPAAVEPLKPIPLDVTELPPADESTVEAPPAVLQAADASQAAMMAPVDSRPVVVVDTLHDGLPATDPRHRVLCSPCDAFFAFHATYHDVFPLRFDVRRGSNVNELSGYALANGTPTFRFPGTGGGWYASKGWAGPEKLLRDYRTRNPKFAANAPPPMLAGAAPGAGQDMGALFAKFSGPARFSYQPDKPVAAYVDPTTYLQYSRLTGSSKLVNGQPAIVFEDPKPQISVKRWGFWVKVELFGSETNLAAKPPTATLNTSRGKFVIKLEEQK